MATYQELFSIIDNRDLLNKLRVAVLVSADKIRSENPTTPNHANRLAWAKDFALADPAQEARKAYRALLGANNASALSVIEAATDATIQTNVDNIVDVLAGS